MVAPRSIHIRVHGAYADLLRAAAKRARVSVVVYTERLTKAAKARKRRAAKAAT